ncbi:SGNH/GDSL hydrolase family protein [Oxalobacteraceae bacterium]|nr:SGNH/GDSL hydrolase family protein [Oxalobacteraceae bacterium]
MKPSLLKWIAGVLLLLPAATPIWAKPGPEVHWTVTWAAAPDSPGPALPPQTLRQIIRTSTGGSSVRVRLSNLFGSGPLTIGPVHVALQANGAAIRPGSDRALTFGGRAGVTIARGGSVLSDAVKMKVGSLQNLSISMYLPAPNGPSTSHGAAMQTAYIVQGSDVTASIDFAGNTSDDTRYFLTDVEVASQSASSAIVVVGDSITDGVGSTDDRDRRWPDALAARLQMTPGLEAIAVVNAGIAGNRILNDGAAPFVGPRALARYERDALSKPGVRWILLFEGINDIAASDMLAAPGEQVTAAQLIDGMKLIIARAHEKKIKIWGATLLPFAGTKALAYTPAGEAKRQALNAWIRGSGAFDAVVDLDQVMRDPANPERLLPAFDSGDHLHPNDAGHQAMAAAIDPRLFARRHR